MSDPQPITGYHSDDEDHWVARLACGHFQHVRHDPPLVSRPWVTTGPGRRSMIGHRLECKKCDEEANPDFELGCDLNTTIPDWIIEHPETTVVFEDFGIDTSCGGKSLRYLCERSGVGSTDILVRLWIAIAERQSG